MLRRAEYVAENRFNVLRSRFLFKEGAHRGQDFGELAFVVGREDVLQEQQADAREDLALDPVVGVSGKVEQDEFEVRHVREQPGVRIVKQMREVGPEAPFFFPAVQDQGDRRRQGQALLPGAALDLRILRCRSPDRHPLGPRNEINLPTLLPSGYCATATTLFRSEYLIIR